MTRAATVPARSYARISVSDPRLRDARPDGPSPAAVSEILSGPAVLAIPSLAFGDIVPDGRAILEHPNGGWRDDHIAHGAIEAVTLRDAIVHGPEGIVTVGDFVISESLAHIPLDQIGCVPSDSHVILPHALVVPVETACHAMGGGHANQFHWLIECVPRLRLPPFVAGAAAGTALLPPRTRAMQFAVEDILLRRGNAVRSPFRGTAIQVGALGFAPNLSGFGFRPHPLLADFFDALLRELGVNEVPRRKIYIARRDSTSRVLANEDDVIALVRRHGFEDVSLEGTTLAEQARLFAGASHIVAPHGAGLANLVFCHPGVSVLELQMDKYLHWVFRRLGALRRIRYGCVIGAADGDPVDGWAHHLRWTVPLAAVNAALSDPRFLRGE